MDEALHDQVIRRLLADEKLAPELVTLVDAACRGAVALDAALADLSGAPRPAAPPRPPKVGTAKEPPGAYLERLEVSGFRGISGAVVLELAPGPGLTLIVGGNGSGKSSLAEGLETVLAGECGRWSGRRSKLWKEGWQNLHGGGTTRLEARLVVEGSSRLTVRRRWKKDEALEAAAAEVSDAHGKATSLEALGWAGALTQFRPFLSYPELGALVEEPSKLFDDLWSLLGLEQINEARDLLGSRKKALEAPKREVREARERLLVELDSLDDPRAARCRKAIGAKSSWDLDAVEEVVLRAPEDRGENDRLAVLRTLARLEAPAVDDLASAASAIRAASDALDANAAQGADLVVRLAGLLAAALEHLETSPDACPVCERPADAGLADRIRERLGTSTKLAGEVRAARTELGRAMSAGKALFSRIDEATLARAEGVGLAGEALREHRAFHSGMPAAPRTLADRIEGAGLSLSAAVGSLASAARALFEEKEAAFRPVRARLAEWVAKARKVALDAPVLEALADSEAWIKKAEADLRAQRFAPVADKVCSTWAALGQTGHVVLEKVSLAGTATQRRLELEVSVDGTEGKAIAVMSQGELNALALSLFLPRMTLPESPFRFLVIDDPVQAMDPHKVDGLARVLGDTAKSRQVIVLTHDARLLDAVRRLRIEATAFEVARRAQSVVEVRRCHGPVEDQLSDAYAMMKAEDKVGSEVVRRVVPGLCRAAIEAACVEVVRRRRLGRGDAQADVEQALEAAHGTIEIVSLALFDTGDRTHDVYKTIENRAGQRAVDALKACKVGAHGGFHGDFEDLVLQSRRIAEKLGDLG